METLAFFPEPADRRVYPGVARWLVRAMLDWAILVACFRGAFWCLFACPQVAVGLAALVPLVVVIAARQHALGLLAHDGAHRLICRNRFLNDALANLLCEWPLMANLDGYRAFHFEHHRKIGTSEDPELLHTAGRLGQWPVPIRPWKFALYLLGDLFGGAIPHLLLAGYLTRAGALRHLIGPVCFVGIAVYVCYRLHALWIPAIWFLSLGTVFWSIFRIRIWTEHVGTSGTHVLRPNALQRFLFLPHNTWCHSEHHEDPKIPCWALPGLRQPSAREVTMGELFASFFDGQRPSGLMRMSLKRTSN